MPRIRLVPLALALALTSTLATPVAAAPRRTVTLAAQGGIGLPVGDFGDAADPGPGGALCFDYWFKDGIAMGVELGVQAWRGDADVEAALAEFMSSFLGEPFDADIRYRAVQYTPHVRAAFPGFSDQGVPWVQVGAGIYDFKTTVELTSPTLGTATGEVSGTYFGLNVGAGVDFAVSPRVKLGGGMTYHWVDAEHDQGAALTQFALTARLSVDLGR